MKTIKNKTKKIIGIALGLLFTFSLMPAQGVISYFKNISKANADVVTTASPNNNSFEILKSENIPSNWTAALDGNIGDNENYVYYYSTTSGSLDTSLLGFNDYYFQKYVDTFLNSKESNGNAVFTETQINTLKENANKNKLMITTPLAPKYAVNGENNKVLMLNAGKTISFNASNKEELADITNRLVYYTYTSEKSSLSPYSFYKLTVSVKTDGITQNGASIKLTGDLKNKRNYWNIWNSGFSI